MRHSQGIKNSEQTVLNTSFDEDYNVLAVENLVYNPTTCEIDRMVQPASSTTQTDGSQKTQIVDAGGEVATVTGGKLDVNATVTSSGGAINDGVDANLKATVKDLTNSNPLTTAIVDGDGTQITSFGGGVQYTEGDTDVSITGTALMHEIASNVLATVSTTNPLPVSASIDTTGLATTTTDTNTTTIAGDTTSIDGKVPALGQALAAGSVPVVLTVAQMTTLTPPSAITGFSTSAKQLADNHQVTVSNIANTPLVNITTLATSAKQLADGHTVALSATDNAVLDAIEVDTTTLAGAVSAGHVQVDVLSMPAGGSSLTDTELRATPVPVSGTVTANLSATDNAVLDNIDTNTDSGAVVGAGAAATAQRVHLADESLTALENITVISSGTVTANAGTNLNTSALALETGGNLASIKTNTDKIPALGQALAVASTPVVLTAAQLTTLTPPAQGLTDTQLRATAVPVSGTVAVTNAGITTIAGAVAGTEMQVDVLTMPSVAVTGTFYQATQPVSGTVTSNLGATDNAVLDVIAAKDFATQTTLAALNAKMVTGTDIGDVTINNSTGAAAVNIQDGGNVITVDGTVAVTNADLTTIAGAVSATHMQADVLTMPTVTVNAHAVTNAGTFAVQATEVDGGNITLGAKADAKSTATDATAITVMQVLKQISASVQAPPTQAVTNANIDVIAGAVSATHMQVDVLTAPSTAVTNAGTFAVQTTSAITGIGHGVKTVTTAGTDVVLAASTACKRVIIQAQTDNTSIISVGGSGVDATVATGTGIILNPGDAFEMEIDNLTDVYIDSLVNGEGVRFCYFS